MLITKGDKIRGVVLYISYICVGLDSCPYETYINIFS